MGTGLIFAAVVALWVAYFVPLALRRYDEASRTGSIDRFSGAMRVLTHRAADGETDPGARAGSGAGSGAESASVGTEPAGAGPLTRESARTAARRRRRTLLTLLASAVVVGALAAFAVLPVWSPAVPGALIVAWLVACRVQVRGELGLGRRARPARGDDLAGGPMREADDAAADDTAGDDEVTVVISGRIEDYEPHRKHVMERTPLEEQDLLEIEVAAVPVSSPTGATLWDPVPVTLPTYVNKPRAARTIRTIEFGEPGAWTSGHVEGEDTEMRRPAESGTEHRRAVGD